MIPKPLSSIGALVATTLLSVTAASAAPPDDQISLEQCLDAAQNVRRGDIVKVEYLSVSPAGAPTYEIEVRDSSGTEWELMCNARTGDIYELETEAESADKEAFARTAKVSEAEAIKTAQTRFGGEVVEVEYEIESNGSPSYEIDLAQEGQDSEFKVEVDAASGEIVELSVEQWQIGQEPDEKANPTR